MPFPYPHVEALRGKRGECLTTGKGSSKPRRLYPLAGVYPTAKVLVGVVVMRLKGGLSTGVRPLYRPPIAGRGYLVSKVIP